jgi:hypothetical protein
MPECGLPFNGKNGNYFTSHEVREYKPCRRTVSINNESYFLPFPYIVFLGYSSYVGSVFYAWFTTKRFNGDLQQKLYMPFLPNVEHGGRVCLFSDSAPPPMSMDQLISSFWTRNFSSYTSHHCNSEAIDMLRGITKQKATKYWDNACLDTLASLSTRQLTARLVNQNHYMRFSRLVSDWGINLDKYT